MVDEKRKSRFKACLLFQIKTIVVALTLRTKEVLLGTTKNKHDKYDKY
jgi:hypothetical protein